MFENEQAQERALLVALDTGEYDAETSLAELGELTESAGAEPAFFLTQKRPVPESATCVGSGMAAEAAELIQREGLDRRPKSVTWKNCLEFGSLTGRC